MNDYRTATDFTDEEINNFSPEKIFGLRINKLEKSLGEKNEEDRERTFYSLMTNGALNLDDVKNHIYHNGSKYPLTKKQVNDFLCFTRIPKLVAIDFIAELHDQLLAIEVMCSTDESDKFKIKKEIEKLRTNIPM